MSFNKTSWCPYPQFNLNSNTDGSAKLCCAILENHHISDGEKKFNLSKDNIENIWNSEYMKNIRADMLMGKRPKVCDVCWRLEDRNLASTRNSVIKENWHNLGAPATTLPTSLELRLGNKCNLKCMSCWSFSSSSVFDERKQAIGNGSLPNWLDQLWKKEVDTTNNIDSEWYKSEKFKENFNKMAPTLRRLYLTGGEPTLIEENNNYLEMLIAANNTNCAISFTTNLTVWNQAFYEQISKFKDVEAQISLDGFGELNNYIRNPSQFNIIERNLDKLLSINSLIKIKIYTVVSLLNFLWLDDLGKYLVEKFKDRQAIWAPIILQAPDFMSTNLASKKSSVVAAQRLNTFFKSAREVKTGLWLEYAEDTLKTCLANYEENTKLRSQYQEYIEALNRIRNTQHPHIEEFVDLGVLHG